MSGFVIVRYVRARTGGTIIPVYLRTGSDGGQYWTFAKARADVFGDRARARDAVRQYRRDHACDTAYDERVDAV